MRAGSTRTLAAAAAVVLCAACGQKPASINVTPAKLTVYGLKKGQTLTAEVLDKKGRRIESALVEWSSDKATVATVDKGYMQTKSAGKAVITAKHQTLTASLPVEVFDVQTILVTPGRITLAGPRGSLAAFNAEIKDSKGKPVTAFKPKWITNDPKVLSVDQNGIATALAEGKGVVSAVLGDIEGAAEVTVVFREIGAVEVNPPTVILRVGENLLLKTLVRDDKGVEIQNASLVWTSSDAAAVKVFSGLVTGLAPGSAIVKGSCGSKSAEVSVLVN